jgi:hypothetical protein
MRMRKMLEINTDETRIKGLRIARKDLDGACLCGVKIPKGSFCLYSEHGKEYYHPWNPSGHGIKQNPCCIMWPQGRGRK